MKHFRLFLISFLGMLSWGLDAQINTTSNRNVGCAPDTFRFYTVGNTHSGQTWNSGNGSNTTIDSPVFSYSIPGTYTVTIGSLSKTIIIYPQLSFNFTTDSVRSGCFPFDFNLRDITSYPTGVTPTTVRWIYQNGGSKIGNPIFDEITSYYLHYCYVTMQVNTDIPSCYGEIRKDSFFRILDVPKAKIDVPVKAACKLPFSPNITNKSKDSLRTNLSYVWKWNLPTAGTSTSIVPPTLIYTTNGQATITLEATNIYGCKGFDTLILKIDTPTLDVTASNRICRSPFKGKIVIQDLDTANFTYEFKSQLRLSGANIFTLESNLKDTTFFTGLFADNTSIDTFAFLYITKRSKADTSCKITVAKKVNICQTYPVPELRFSKNCGPPFMDTIIAHKWTPCWDTIRYRMFYIDKYGITVTIDSFNASKIDSTSRMGPDTILAYGLQRLLKTDSFYRRGPMKLHANIEFVNSETKCSHSFPGFIHADQISLFRPHLVNYYGKGCAGRKDSFVLYNYGLGSIDSVTWHLGDGTIKKNKLTTLEHIFPNAGYYKTYAIVKNTLGCIDTVNPVFTKRADSILPSLSISKYQVCVSDSIEVTISNPQLFDKWYFLADKEKSTNCFESYTNTLKDFYHTGIQYVYLTAEKDGCFTSVQDSILVSGPKFNLHYDFKCSRRDSILFYLTDTADIETQIKWDFGDGTVMNTLEDSIWHTFSGDSIDYTIRLHSQNSNACEYEDSAKIKIRKVKAIFKDTLFCKQENPSLYLNGIPYTLNPHLSRNADMDQGYKYTWQLQSILPSGAPGKKYPPYTSSDSIPVHIWEDTMLLTLTARDINGCEDQMTKRIILTDNKIDFTVNYTDSCPPAQMIQLQNLSSSPFGIASAIWTVYRVRNGNDTVFLTSNTFNSSFYAETRFADTFKIRLEIKDVKNCKDKTMDKFFIFVSDTSRLFVPDTLCEDLDHGIINSENNLSKYHYQWYVNQLLLPDDTTHQLKFRFQQLGWNYIKLEKTNRQTGCTRVFVDSSFVTSRPRLFIENSFDSASNKCFPAVTTVRFFDSASIPNLGFKYMYKGSPRIVNPATIDLEKGPNLIEAVFWTSFGCHLTIPILDTVYSPDAQLVMDKKAICKNDSIVFSLVNAQDVDTVLWSFGDGTIYVGTERTIRHRYTSANPVSDSIPISFIAYAPNRSCPLAKVDTVLVYEAISKQRINDGLDTAFCQRPFTIHNLSPRADYFKWRMSNGDSTSNDQDSFIYSFDSAGFYQIIQYAFRSPLGCVDSSLTNVRIFPKPKINASIDTICLGQPLLISYTVDLPNTKIYLSPDSFKGSPFILSPIKTEIKSNTLFTISGISDVGCKDSIQVQANVLLPIQEKSWDTTVEMGKRIVLPVGYDSKWTYTWSPLWINPSCFNCAQPELQIFDSVTYTLNLEDYKKCFKSTYTYTIRIYPDIVVKVPTAFTPNGDGNNDIMYAKGFGIKKLLSFKIFNRQGQLLFVSNSESIGWDGKYRDEPQNSDVYYYTFEAESFIPGKLISGEGNFMLLR